uniref:Uncharacterized protein n=1 Tax=Arundo donax TaxID=35708 RepID=A0A0A9GZQ5_ARUDO
MAGPWPTTASRRSPRFTWCSASAAAARTSISTSRPTFSPSRASTRRTS